MKATIHRPKPFRKETLTRELVAGAGKIARQVQKDFQKTTATWNHQPDFVVEVESTPNKLTLTVSTDDEIYGYVDEGTKVRHAVMSPDWKSKTKPASGGAVRLTSHQGSGRMVFVSRKINRPGIKARKFSMGIKRKWKRKLADQMQRHLDAAARKAGG